MEGIPLEARGIMLSSELKQSLPTSKELPCSDDTPVDNEDQNFLPNVLLFVLNALWANRHDWFFGVDMAIYHTTGKNPRVPVVPDGFLSLGVARWKPSRKGRGRLSYVMWEENEIPPILVLELVSHTYGDEYDEKMEIYRNLGVLYYVIYNPEFWQRDRHQPFEVYKLVNGAYQLQIGEPYCMLEVGLGIGRYMMTVGGVQQEGLAWFDPQGNRCLTGDERSQQEQQRAEQAQQRLQRLADRLRELGEDPDQL